MLQKRFSGDSDPTATAASAKHTDAEWGLVYRIILNYVVPSTNHPWGAILALDTAPAGSNSLQLLPMAHVCQAWRAAVQPSWVESTVLQTVTLADSWRFVAILGRIWRRIHVMTVSDIHKLELLTRLDWLTSLIENVAVELRWEEAFRDTVLDENWHSEIRGEIEDYFFGDRQAVVNRLVAAGHVEDDDEDYYQDGELFQLSEGPDGTGFHPVLKNADDAIESLEQSIPRLQNLQRFVWQTLILPMPSSVRHHLSQLESLRLLRLEQQGEFMSSKRLPAPLWEIFSPGKQLDALALGTRVLPLYANVSYEMGLDDKSHTLTRAIHNEYDDAEIPLPQPNRLFLTPLEALPPLERPLAMATRLLQTCANNGRVRFVCLGGKSECLLRFRHLAHVWVKLPVTTPHAMWVYGRKRHLDRWLSAANGIRPALMELASRKGHHRTLEASEIASLPEGREELEPFADWLREDQQVQMMVAETWNVIVQEGHDRSLPRSFSVQRVNDPELTRDDAWINVTRYEYVPL